ncbi:MAG: AMP-binding protein [Casimicrobiaceae bacterium]
MTTAAAHNVASFLWRSARCWPSLPALAVGTRVTHDYATFAHTAARFAAGMIAAGLAPGDRIAIVARNTPDYLVALFSAWWAGMVAVPVNAKLHPRELAYVLADSRARLVLVDATWAGAIESSPEVCAGVEWVVRLGSREHRALAADATASLPAACAPDDAAWLFYTSGTTGRPKGVVITHANLRAMTQCYLSDVEAISPGDAWLHPAPLSHGSGLYAVPNVLGAAVNVIPESGAFDAHEMATLLETWRGAAFFAAPTMVKRLVESNAVGEHQLARLKCIVYGGGPMYVEDCRAAFDRFGPRLAQIYGQGESPMTITAMSKALLADAMARDDVARIGSVGIAQTGMALRVTGPGDVDLATGEVGEVLVRGPAVMRGYWDNEAATAGTLAGGWLHTGDVGSLDVDGFLTLRDRSKDLIISGGANIYPREIEEVLLGHPDVAETAVIGRIDPEWGEDVVAFVVIRGTPAAATEVASTLAAELDARCRARIARFKRPRHYVFIAELPKNNTGKVLKTALREQLAALPGNALIRRPSSSSSS